MAKYTTAQKDFTDNLEMQHALLVLQERLVMLTLEQPLLFSHLCKLLKMNTSTTLLSVQTIYSSVLQDINVIHQDIVTMCVH